MTSAQTFFNFLVSITDSEASLALFLRMNVRPNKTLNRFSRNRLCSSVKFISSQISTPLYRYNPTDNAVRQRTRLNIITSISKELIQINKILNKLNDILVDESAIIIYKFLPISTNIPSWSVYFNTSLAPFERRGTVEVPVEVKEREVKTRSINGDYLSENQPRWMKLTGRHIYEHENPIAFLAWLTGIRHLITIRNIESDGFIRTGSVNGEHFSFFYENYDIISIVEFVFKSHGGYKINMHRTDKGKGKRFSKDTSCLCHYDECIRDIGVLLSDLYHTLVPDNYAICKCGSCLETNPFYAKLFYVRNFTTIKTFMSCRHGHRFCNRCGYMASIHHRDGTCPDSDQHIILNALNGMAYWCPGPNCKNIIDKKDDGSCNHMTCDQCNTHSCNICHKILHPTNGEISEHYMFGPNRCPQYNR
jgi:hypothetical protein